MIASAQKYIALLSAAGIALHLLLHSSIPLYVVLAAGGVPLVWELARKLLAREFGADMLAGISIATSLLLGQYLVGAIVVLMLSGGSALEEMATARASSVLNALARRMPQIAHRRSGDSLTDTALNGVAIGDLLLVLPHEICPVDGVVTEGHGVMDESYLTGEPFRIAKTPGSSVLSGAINGDCALTIRAEKLAVDSRYAKIMQVMEATAQKQPRLRRIGDRLGAWYTPLALAVAAAGWAASGDSQRFLAVLVIATPCPLLIAIPVTVIGAISLSARRGIIIKSPAALEKIAACGTLIFDKTGTLTYGAPSLTEILCAPGFDRRQVLRLAASVERYSKHPLAGAIVAAAEKEDLVVEPVSKIEERPGDGLCAEVDGHTVRLTSRKQVPDADLPPPAEGLECAVLLDDRFAAIFRFRDTPRRETRSFVSHLKPSHNVKKVMLVSGDRESEVRYLAQQAGIEDVSFGKSPEEKVAIVMEETRHDLTLFVGDGINDAPALMAATVGVAFGQNSDITSEAADAVVLSASLDKVDELIHIGRRMRTIALQCAIGGMAASLAGMVAAALGYLPPLTGAIAQEVIDVVAVLNAVRVAIPPKDLTDF